MYWSGAKTVRFPLPATVLNGARLPSIAGLEASRPILPRPSTAVSLVMTATRLPRAAYSNALVGQLLGGVTLIFTGQHLHFLPRKNGESEFCSARLYPIKGTTAFMV